MYVVRLNIDIWKGREKSRLGKKDATVNVDIKSRLGKKDATVNVEIKSRLGKKDATVNVEIKSRLGKKLKIEVRKERCFSKCHAVYNATVGRHLELVICYLVLAAHMHAMVHLHACPSWS